ncbi:MAG: TIGR00725 family protein [Clostridiales bacterium]|nr:TIGR00725 family protein [Clostridiales bacterium]
MRTIIGVMGAGHADAATCALARELGSAIAARGWVLLNGGRDSGVMAASAEGASAMGGLVVGILPGDDHSGIAPGVDLAVLTGMGDARNVINVLSSHVVVALQGGAGTLSEIAHALNSRRPVVVIGWDPGEHPRRIGGERLAVVPDVSSGLAAIERFLEASKIP